MNNNRLLLTIFTLFFTSNFLFSQKYFFRNYSLKEGLPQSEILDMIEDRRGNLWLGLNIGGLVRMEGEKFKLYTDKEGLPASSIQRLFEDSKGNIWITSLTEGISMFDGRKFTSYTDSANFLSSTIPVIRETEKGEIVALALNRTTREQKIFKLAKDKNEFVDSKQQTQVFGNSNNGVLYKNKLIWGGNNGLFFFDGDSLQPDNLNNHPKFKDRRGILPFHYDKHHDILWIWSFNPNQNNTVPNTLYQFDGREYKQFVFPQQYQNAFFNRMDVSKDGTVWFSIVGQGILRFKDNEFKMFNRQNGLIASFFTRILTDREGNTWAATRGNGLIQMTDEKFLNFTTDDLPDLKITGNFYEDSKGNIWIGTWGNGFTVYDRTTTKSYFGFNSQVRIGRIMSFYEEDNNSMLIAYGGGNGIPNNLIRFNGEERINSVIQEYGIPQNTFITDITSPVEGEIWFSTGGRGIYIYDKKTKKTRVLNTQSGLANNSITHILQDKQGDFVFPSNTGVIFYNKDTSILYNNQQAFEGSFPLMAISDYKDNIWFIVYGKGVFKYDRNNFVNLKDNPHVPKIVYNLIEDDEKNIWLGGQNGIYRLNINKEGEILSNLHYTREDGFIGDENNSRAIFKDTHGHIWFGHLEGAARYNPENDIPNNTPPIAQITSVNFPLEKTNWTDTANWEYYETLPKWFDLPEKLSLPYSNNNLSFELAAITYKAPKKVKYQWMLDGYDKTWLPITQKTEASYSNIPGGNYTFKLRVMNENKVWSEVATYSFKVKPPFYETWYFRIAAIGFIISLTFTGVKMRIRNIEEQKRQLEKIVEQRTKEVVEQKNEILEKNTELEQQTEEIAAQRDMLEVQNDEIKEKNVELEQQTEEIAAQRDTLEVQNNKIAQKSDELQIAFKSINEQNKNIKASLNYAKRIQLAILPNMDRVRAGLKDIFVLYQPRDIVSGDFYWYGEQDNKIIIAAADCTGHGVPGAFMSMIGDAYFNHIVNVHDITCPATILNELHKGIYNSLKQGETENQDGMDIAVCTIDKTSKTLSFAGAKNPLYYSRNGELNIIKGDKHPVGGMLNYTTSERTFTSHTIDLVKDTTYYIFSDGFQDQFGGPKGKKFMVKRFKELLLETSGMAFNEQKQFLENTYNSWKEGQKQIDDLLVIGFKYDIS